MQIATSKTRESYPLSTKKIIKKTLTATIGWTVLALIIWILMIIAQTNSPQMSSAAVSVFLITLIILAVIVLLTFLYQKWYFAVYFYELTPDFIVIKKGPITPKEITIPYERVQDVYVDQDIFDRMFGLYDVHLSSATISSGMEAHIDGLESQAAGGLRDLLLKTVSEKINKSRGNYSQPAPQNIPQ
jgi:membrane protein YdbS with pleckstrin-like domain